MAQLIDGTHLTRETDFAHSGEVGADGDILPARGNGQERGQVCRGLVQLQTAGDELQGMKKGVMELADAIVVNKADGDNKQRAMVTRAEYERILQFLRQATENWTTHAYTCSAYTGAGIMELWNDVIEAFMKHGWGNGVLVERRKQQTLSWVYTMVEEHLHNLFYRSPAIIGCKEEIEREVVGGKISATMAVQDLINRFAAAELSGVNVKDSSPFEIK